MPKYRVSWTEEVYSEIEADSKEQAEDKALCTDFKQRKFAQFVGKVTTEEMPNKTLDNVAELI